MGPIRFYFDFASPYGYLASTGIDELAKAHDRDVLWRPMMLGPALKATGSEPNLNMPLKGDYLKVDVARTAREMGVPLELPPSAPIVSLLAARGFYWLEEQKGYRAVAFAKAAYYAHWGQGRDIMLQNEIVAVAGEIGIDGAALIEGTSNPGIKERLKTETTKAIDRGVFGSPFFIVDDEAFWGVDKMPQLGRWLQKGGW